MNKNLPVDFTIDKANNSMVVIKEYAADLSLVWDAFTKPEIIDQWGAPEPWAARTIAMDFRVGGRRFFKIVSPEGQEHFSVQDYTSITPTKNLNYLSGFSDKDENINPDVYGTANNLDFSEANGVTTVRITIKYKTRAVLEQMIARGHQQGFTLTLNNLERLLATMLQK